MLFFLPKNEVTNRTTVRNQASSPEDHILPAIPQCPFLKKRKMEGGFLLQCLPKAAAHGSLQDFGKKDRPQGSPWPNGVL